MKLKLAVASIVGALVQVGCAPHRPGLIHNLPAPLFDIPVPRPSATVSPVRPLSIPQVPPVRGSVPPHWWPPGGISNRWNYIVIHHSGSVSGNARQFDNYHRNVKHWDELGYHFVIGNGTGSGDGEVEVGPRWIKQKHGAHCKTPGNYYNEHGIGICLVGDYRRNPPSDAQMASLIRLVLFLMRECGIPAENVVTHGGVTHHTVCPGPLFPINGLRQTLIGRLAGRTVP